MKNYSNFFSQVTYNGGAPAQNARATWYSRHKMFVVDGLLPFTITIWMSVIFRQLSDWELNEWPEVDWMKDSWNKKIYPPATKSNDWLGRWLDREGRFCSICRKSDPDVVALMDPWTLRSRSTSSTHAQKFDDIHKGWESTQFVVEANDHLHKSSVNFAYQNGALI